jgi:16S rRNA (guanine527-N7)-methyltransferase
MDLIPKYFPDLEGHRYDLFRNLLEVVPRLNRTVNVISRKDIGSLEERHVLHSLAIARKFTFTPGQSVVDVGTGGGFPGIPLAILFPDTRFFLVDSIAKKCRVAGEIATSLRLANVTVIRGRIEELSMQTDYAVSRAVATLPRLAAWTGHLFGNRGCREGGLIALKGGDLQEELKEFGNEAQVFPVSDWFDRPFFSAKFIVYIKKSLLLRPQIRSS